MDSSLLLLQGNTFSTILISDDGNYIIHRFSLSWSLLFSSLLIFPYDWFWRWLFYILGFDVCKPILMLTCSLVEAICIIHHSFYQTIIKAYFGNLVHWHYSVVCVLDRDDSPITEVEPYIPFTINPAGMQPVLTTTYLLAFPSILARSLFIT